MILKRLSLLLVIYLMVFVSRSQCSLCRTQIANNVNAGDDRMAYFMNQGILFLLAVPYIAVGVVGYLWYRNSRSREITEK